MNKPYINTQASPATPRGRVSGWRATIAAGLAILGLAALTQTSRADYVLLDDNFNNASNNVANNSDGIGSGITTAVPLGGGITAATETNSLINILSDINGAYRVIWDSVDAIPINGGGTTFEFRNVSFTNVPSNTGTGGTDRTVLGITATNTAGDWLENTALGVPAGFWIQINSDGLASTTSGSGSPQWDHLSTLYYTDGLGNRTIIYQWTFDNLTWGGGVTPNWTPVLDFKLNVSSSGIAFSVTGDTQGGGNAIGITNTYSAIGFSPNLFNGLIPGAHMGAASQTENPGIEMSVDRIIATQLGALVVTTPVISTPEYGYATNVVYADEVISFKSTVTDGATPTYHWQLEDLSSPGTFTNLPGASATTTNLVLDTSSLGDSQPRGVRLVANDGVNTVISPVVELTVNPPSAPILTQDVPAGPIQITAGATLVIQTIFTGNQPMTNVWQYSANNTTFGPLSTQTNQTLTLRNISLGASGYYKVYVTNVLGSAVSSVIQIQVVPPNPIYPTPGSYGSYALYTNNAYAFWQLNETNDPSSGFVQAFDFSGNGHAGTYRNGAQAEFNGILAPQPPTFPGFASGQGALQTGPQPATNTLVVLPPLNIPTNITDTTISVWIYPNAAVQANAAVFATRSTTAGHVEAIEFTGNTINGLRTLGYNWNDSATAYNFDTHMAPPLNTWSFVTLVVQTNQVTEYLCYIDPNSNQAVLESAVNQQTCHPETFLDGTNFLGTTLIGDDVYAANRTFPGSISDLAIYHAALTKAQIQQMFAVAVGVSGFPASVVTQPPSNVSAYSGFTVTIPAVTSGSGNITNQWLYNGTPLTDGPFNGSVVSGSSTATLTILQATPAMNNGVFTLTTSNALGGAVSSATTLSVLTPQAPVGATIIGQWLAGSPNFKDASGYTSGGLHDAYLAAGTSYYFTNDVPPVAPHGAKSLRLGGAGLAIRNSSTLDSNYDGLFDNGISNAMTITFWAKGWPGGWNAFVSKYGEGPGWQIRNDGNNNVSPCWTLRGAVHGTVSPTPPATAVYGDVEDLAATSLTYGNDGKWHFYAANYDVNSGVRELYVDGVLAAQATGVGQYNTAPVEHLAIGTKDSPPGNSFGGNFTGLIYDVRVYNASLGADQEAYAGTATLPAPPGLDPSKFLPGAGGGGKYVVSWYGGTLQQSTNLTGPWTASPSQTSPITNDVTTAPQLFFRVVH
jgi:hypothetical protein